MGSKRARVLKGWITSYLLIAGYRTFRVLDGSSTNTGISESAGAFSIDPLRSNHHTVECCPLTYTDGDRVAVLSYALDIESDCQPLSTS